MDRPWRDSDYGPTISDAVSHDWKPLSAGRRRELSSKIRNVTKLLRCLPYSSQFWIQRAICLQELGYPDLALGDAHKARSLAEAAFANASLLGTKVRLSSAMAELAVDPQAWKQEANRERRLASALKRAQRNAYDCLWTNLLRVGLLEDMFDEIDGFRKYSNLPRSEVDRLPPLYKSWRSMTLASPVTDQVDPDDLVRNGSIQPRAYPWMDQDMIVRSREVAESANATMRKDSASKCEVGQSPVKNEIDVWGVFASKPIKKGDVFLIDKSMAVIDNRRSEGYCSCGKRLPTQPVKPPCCNRSFCSEQCADRVLQTYHKVVCRKEFNFSNLPNEPGKRNRRYLETMLLIRLLAIITQHDKEHSNDDGHPLHGPIIKYLTPNYGAGQSAAWNFLDAIVHPTKILETLGVDVYADQRYDTWVLQTIRWRIANNAFSAVDGDIADVGYNGIWPLYSLFNHSCERNSSNSLDVQSSAFKITALRDIRKGEELSISYTSTDGLSRPQRQQLLHSWFDGACGCIKCTTES